MNPQIGVTKPPVASEEPLHAELKSFLRAVRERSTPEVPLEDGRRALALALEIVGAIRDHGKKVGSRARHCLARALRGLRVLVGLP